MPPTLPNLLLKSAVILSLFIPHAAMADPVTESIENALKFGQKDAKYGQVKFNLRYRYEHDDTKRPTKKVGNASTVRLRLGYLSPEFHGFQAYAEYEMNQDIGVNTYNSLRNGHGGFEVIADPQEHELNQLWVSYKGIPDTEIKIGRQRIKLDNDRFIGNVGWRQMEQTFDSVLITNKSLPNTTVKAGYISQAQTILSTVDPMQTPFVNISYKLEDIGTLTGYGYWMDINSATGGPYNLNASNQTFGVSFMGKPTIAKDIKAVYRLEYAYQKDYGDNPSQYETDYYHVMGGISAFDITAKIGFEQLDGAGAGTTFDTPLATGHAFNGWSDQFLATPSDGLRDVYASLGAKIKGVKLLAVYHEFTDDTGQLDYGNEWNFLVKKKFAKHYSVLAKYAYFDGNNGRFDAQNFWLEAGMSF
ncbi:MAG: alginate export family protein [Methylococcales bacterium]|nr:alginate export family protein [Methylococcales bacterium]